MAIDRIGPSHSEIIFPGASDIDHCPVIARTIAAPTSPMPIPISGTRARRAIIETPSARHWFGFVAVHTVKVAAEKAKSLEGIKLARALEDEVLPPEVALQPGSIAYRAGDHELMSNVFVGQVHPPKGDPANVFSVAELVPGAQAAGPASDTGCQMKYPST